MNNGLLQVLVEEDSGYIKEGRNWGRSEEHSSQILRPYRVKNLVGQRFDRLEVISMGVRKRIGNRFEYWWSCKCDCGNLVEVRRDSLKSGKTRSCGCLRLEVATEKLKKVVGYNILPSGESHFRQILNSYKNSAKRRKLFFDIEEGMFKELISRNCEYCGSAPSVRTTISKFKHGHFPYTGLDRIDSSKGYTVNNVVPCCKRCNYAKGKMSRDEFKSFIRSVYEHWAIK